MLLEFSKPEIINSLKNFSNSLLCFIAVSSVGSPFVIIYCAGAQVGELNICADSTGVGCDDRWTSCPPTMGHGPPQVLPLSQGRDRCCFCCCHCHTPSLGLVAPWMVQTCGCVPERQASCSVSGLCALEPEPTGHSAAWYLDCSHTASLSHQTSLTVSKTTLLRIQENNPRTLHQTWDPCESRALCEWPWIQHGSILRMEVQRTC